MPPMMVVPTERRPAAPAPEAMASGITPRMKANDVIRMGRRRSSAASMAASTMERPLRAELLGELDDQDGVFGGESDEHDETDLAVDVVGVAAQGYGEQRAEHGHGHGQQDDEGQREALIESGEGEIDDENAEAEDDDGFAGRLDFLQRQAGPFIGHAVHHVLVARPASMAARPSLVLTPGAAEPSISAERKRL